MRLCVFWTWIPKRIDMPDWRQGNEFSVGPPKLPIGTVANPHFTDFMIRNEAPLAKTQDFLAKLRGIQKASLQIDFQEMSIYH